MKTLTKKFKELPLSDKIYAGTVVPFWISFTIYMLTGVPIYMG